MNENCTLCAYWHGCSGSCVGFRPNYQKLLEKLNLEYGNRTIRNLKELLKMDNKNEDLKLYIQYRKSLREKQEGKS